MVTTLGKKFIIIGMIVFFIVLVIFMLPLVPFPVETYEYSIEISSCDLYVRCHNSSNSYEERTVLVDRNFCSQYITMETSIVSGEDFSYEIGTTSNFDNVLRDANNEINSGRYDECLWHIGGTYLMKRDRKLCADTFNYGELIQKEEMDWNEVTSGLKSDVFRGSTVNLLIRTCDVNLNE